MYTQIDRQTFLIYAGSLRLSPKIAVLVLLPFADDSHEQ